jgi:SAM-dependent methyltransferase
VTTRPASCAIACGASTSSGIRFEAKQALAEYHRVLKPGGSALIVEANRYNPIFYPHMTLALGHEHFTGARFGAFEAHYAVPLNRLLPLQHAIEEALGHLAPFRPFLSYNFTVASR